MYKSAKEAKLWRKAFLKQRLFTNWGAFPKIALADPVVRQRCIIRVGARHLGHRVALTLAHALLALHLPLEEDKVPAAVERLVAASEVVVDVARGEPGRPGLRAFRWVGWN